MDNFKGKKMSDFIQNNFSKTMPAESMYIARDKIYVPFKVWVHTCVKKKTNLEDRFTVLHVATILSDRSFNCIVTLVAK